MKLEEILDNWDIDSKIDSNNLSNESYSISKIQSKYIREYTSSKLFLSKLENDLKILKKEKFEYYVYGPTEETKEKGWNQYPIGRKILKSDVNIYIDSDQNIIDLNNKISYSKEKIEALTLIIKALQDRNFSIKNGVEIQKYLNGG